MEQKAYLAIDLKSFYASVECVERKLDPLRTHLVVADKSRTEKTICLAVSPSLKAYGIPGRPRLFEVTQKIREVNRLRLQHVPNRVFSGSSCLMQELEEHPERAVSFLVAQPRMGLYIEYSTRIFQIYLNYVSAEDIHVYSIDEVFLDVTQYLKTYRMTARELASAMIRDVLKATGITATVGIGTNLYLCKVAMDIVAKHTKPDRDGVRIAELDESSYRRLLWSHRPLTDFWRVGRGYASKLEANGMFTMGDVARCSVGRPDEPYNEELLYRLFGVNAELLIDHAWGWEPCTIADIKAYEPSTHSIGSGQVLPTPYTFAQAKLVVREMAESLALELVEKCLVTDGMTLAVGYDTSAKKREHAERSVKPAHGNVSLGQPTSSARQITEAVMSLFDRIADRKHLIRRLNLTANNTLTEAEARSRTVYEQMDFFSDGLVSEESRQKKEAKLEKEKQKQQAVLHIKKKYGKNAILNGMDLESGATAVERNGQIGGHKA